MSKTVDEMSREDIWREITRRKVAIAEMRAYHRARLDTACERLLADPLLAEALRADAWRRAGNRNVQVDEHGRLVGVPTDWPEGVDGEAVVRERVEAEFAPLYEVLDATPSSASLPDSHDRRPWAAQGGNQVYIRKPAGGT